MFSGKGGVCYLCRFHHDEVEERILKTERLMSDGFKGRYKLDESEYIEILTDYLNETVPIQTPQLSNVVAFPRRRPIRNHRLL